MYSANNSENFKIMDESREALRKLEKEKISKRDPLEVLSEVCQKSSMGRDLFETYDALLWEGKVKVDMLYLDQLLQKVEENEKIYGALGNYFKNIREIYEHVNLKPEVYGRGITYQILNESNEVKKQKLSTAIYEYLDNNFYSLTAEQKKDKYLENSREHSKSLISDGVSPEEAISFATKVVIMENLLTKIAFPFSVWARIEYLNESDDYRKVFDQEKLNTIIESFRDKVSSLAKIVAVTV